MRRIAVDAYEQAKNEEERGIHVLRNVNYLSFSERPTFNHLYVAEINYSKRVRFNFDLYGLV